MTMNHFEQIHDALEGIEVYGPVLMNVHQKQRAALHVIFQCAETALKSGDCAEAARLYRYLYAELQLLWHEQPSSLKIPDYTKPLIDVSRWARPEMFELAEVATNPVAPRSAAAKLLYMVLPYRYCAAAVGDLDEEFTSHVVPRFGLDFAERWYRRQVVLTIAHFWLARPLSLAWNQVKEVAVQLISRIAP